MFNTKKFFTCFFIFFLACFFLYFFLVGLDLLGNAFKILAGDSAGEMFAFVSNPFAGIVVGILATVLLQSSSTSTSIVVSIVGAGAMDVESAIPIIMGCNLGTSSTSTIVSFGFFNDKEKYERAFAGATVHDLFNLLNVIIWFPLEYFSNLINDDKGGILFLISQAMVKGYQGCEDCEKWVSPIKEITSELTSKIIKVDKDVIKDFSQGRPEPDMCFDLCDVTCKPYTFNRKQCVTPGLLAENSTICGNEGVSKKAKGKFQICSENTMIMDDAQKWFDDYKLNKAGAFYDAGWSDQTSGIVSLLLSLFILIVCLIGLVKTLNYALRGKVEEWVEKSTEKHGCGGATVRGYFSIIVGIGVTILVQSSSITTSVLIPLVAAGAVSIESSVPIVFGANIGTTVTGILAALVSDSKNGFQIAFVHLLFNLFGVLTFYPIPKIRAIPIVLAKYLGYVASRIRPFAVIYTVMFFFVYPLLVLGFSIGFESSPGGKAGTSIAFIFVCLVHVYVIYWYKKKDGKQKIADYLHKEDTASDSASVGSETSCAADSEQILKSDTKLYDNV